MCFIEPVSVSNYEVKHCAMSLLKLSLMDIIKFNPLDFLEKISQQYSIWLCWRVYTKAAHDLDSFGTYILALSVTIRHTRTGYMEESHATPPPLLQVLLLWFLMPSDSHCREVNLLHRSLLGKVFQDHGQGCAEEPEAMGHHIGQDQANHIVSIWGQRRGLVAGNHLPEATNTQWVRWSSVW